MATKPSPRSSIRIARINGIDVRMHWSFLALLLFVVWAEWASGLGQVGVWLLWIAAVFGAVLVHSGDFSPPSEMPGALIEPLFITDPFEGTLAAITLGQEAIAAGVEGAVEQFLTASPNASTNAPSP